MASIIVHGGAKELPPEEHAAHLRGCEAAAEAGWKVLEGGGTALEAVEAAIRVMEDDPTFNAGIGSELNEDGQVQMDAAVMDGGTLDAGAVATIGEVRHPISCAHLVLQGKEVFLSGDGARKFALERGAESCSEDELRIPKRLQEWEKMKAEESKPKANDTVGCVAMDREGNIAVGASTGGMGNHKRGRVGDTPQIGCGIYAENELGGCSCTGEGEAISRAVLAFHVVTCMGTLTADVAADRGMSRLEVKANGEGGCIVISRAGSIGWAHNSKHMPVSYRVDGMSKSATFIRKEDETTRAAA